LGDVKEERKRVDDIGLLDEGEIDEMQRFVSALIESRQNRREEENGVADNARRRKRLLVSDIV